jgi:hypothetical protein
MSLSRTEYFVGRIFRAGELAAAIRTVLRDMFPSNYDADVSIFRELPDGSKKSLHRQTIGELGDVCDLSSQGSFAVTIGRPLGNLGVANEFEFSLRAAYGSIGVSATAETAEQLGEFFASLTRLLSLERGQTPYETGAEEAEERERERVADELDLERRVGRLEERLPAGPRPLTCFLSYQFEGVSLDYGRLVKHFLELLDVRVLTGSGYEPKTVQDKVRHRLASGIDFVVLIEPNAKTSAWTRDEIAVTQTPGVYLIPLVERGGTFQKGIYGDHEYIEFEPGHIGDAFVGLLEGVVYLRRSIEIPRKEPGFASND